MTPYANIPEALTDKIALCRMSRDVQSMLRSLWSLHTHEEPVRPQLIRDVGPTVFHF